MLKKRWILTLVAIGLCLEGCGGSGNAAGGNTPFPFAGYYHAQLNVMDNNSTFLAGMHVSIKPVKDASGKTSGVISGTTFMNSLGQSVHEPVTGSIQQDGSLAMSFEKYHLSGTMQLDIQPYSLVFQGIVYDQGNPQQMMLTFSNL